MILISIRASLSTNTSKSYVGERDESVAEVRLAGTVAPAPECAYRNGCLTLQRRERRSFVREGVPLQGVDPADPPYSPPRCEDAHP